MSVSLWKWTEDCPMDRCTGDCDLCTYESEADE